MKFRNKVFPDLINSCLVDLIIPRRSWPISLLYIKITNYTRNNELMASQSFGSQGLNLHFGFDRYFEQCCFPYATFLRLWVPGPGLFLKVRLSPVLGLGMGKWRKLLGFGNFFAIENLTCPSRLSILYSAGPGILSSLSFAPYHF